MFCALCCGRQLNIIATVKRCVCVWRFRAHLVCFSGVQWLNYSSSCCEYSIDPYRTGEWKSQTEAIVARDHNTLSICRRWLNGYSRKRQQICWIYRQQSQPHPHGRGGNNNKFYLSVKLLMYWFIQCAAQVSATLLHFAALFCVQQIQKPNTNRHTFEWQQ